MSVLGHNYNVQCMLLLHQLRSQFHSVPDETVKQCIRKHGTSREKCIEELTRLSESSQTSKHKNRQRLKSSHRRYSLCDGARYSGIRSLDRRSSLCVNQHYDPFKPGSHNNGSPLDPFKPGSHNHGSPLDPLKGGSHSAASLEQIQQIRNLPLLEQGGDENWMGDQQQQRRGSYINRMGDRQRRGSSMSIQEENMENDGTNVLMAVDQNITDCGSRPGSATLSSWTSSATMSSRPSSAALISRPGSVTPHNQIKRSWESSGCSNIVPRKMMKYVYSDGEYHLISQHNTIYQDHQPIQDDLPENSNEFTELPTFMDTDISVEGEVENSPTTPSDYFSGGQSSEVTEASSTVSSVYSDAPTVTVFSDDPTVTVFYDDPTVTVFSDDPTVTVFSDTASDISHGSSGSDKTMANEEIKENDEKMSAILDRLLARSVSGAELDESSFTITNDWLRRKCTPTQTGFNKFDSNEQTGFNQFDSISDSECRLNDFESCISVPQSDPQRSIKNSQGLINDSQRSISDSKSYLTETQRSIIDSHGSLSDSQSLISDSQKSISDSQRSTGDTKRLISDSQRSTSDTKRSELDMKIPLNYSGRCYNEFETCINKYENETLTITSSEQNLHDATLDDVYENADDRNATVNADNQVNNESSKTLTQLKKMGRLKRKIPQPLTFTDQDLPTVVLTPDSPPKDAPGLGRQIETLYTPKFKIDAVRVPDMPECLPHLPAVASLSILPFAATNNKLSSLVPHPLGYSLPSPATGLIMGSGIDVLPGIENINLPFGKSTLSVPGVEVRRSSGPLHIIRDLVVSGTVSLASTSLNTIQQSVISSYGNFKGENQRVTLPPTENKIPKICDHPFRKVFAQRQQFYASQEKRANVSPDTSSKRLVWRHCNHMCKSGHQCSEESARATSVQTLPTQRCFTLSANIEPFQAFSIKHSLKDSETDDSMIDVTVCPPKGDPVKLLPDEEGFMMYESRMEIPGQSAQAHLEVKVQRDGSIITTKRTGSSDCTSNEISVQLLEGGSRVNIQQSQVCVPLEQKPVRPTSLYIPAEGSRYSTARPVSLYHGHRSTSPMSQPRYYSLPNLKGTTLDINLGPGSRQYQYQSHPRDEEKRVAYTRELLSQQMEQLLKLEANLKQEKFQVDLLNEEVIHLKEELDKKSFMLELRTKAKTNELNTDIRNLQFECERMKDKISGFKKKSGYKSPDNSIKLTKPDVPESNQNKSLTLEGLNASSSQIKNTSETKSIKSITLNPGCSSSENANLMAEEDAGMEPDWEEVISDEKWSCSQCTFANHPCLDTCEMCSMPRIKSTPDNSTNSLCTVHNHPQTTNSPCYQNQSRSKIFSLPKLRRSGDNTE